jgi:cytochrome P450
MRSAVATGLEADELLHRLLATTEGQSDPYPLYRALRVAAPVHRSELDGMWYASGFAAARRILLDPCFGKAPRLTVRRHGVPEERVQMAERRPIRPSMITANPPEHARLRGAAKGAFIPTRIESIRSRIASLVEDRLDHLAAMGTADVMAELAGPLPLTVIGELLGVPEQDRAEFRRLVLAMLSADDPHQPPEAAERAEAASIQIEKYLRDLVNARRACLGDDVLSMLVERHDGGTLAAAELTATVFLLLAAGIFTTTNLIGNGLLALVQHPTQMNRLWADPDIIEPAVEEMLRYDTPVQLIVRHVLSDAKVEGASLKQGETVVVLLGAANHDPASFPQPDRFDVGRPDNGHLSFAWGSHFCLGARLARLEAQLVFSGLRARFSRLELAGEPVRRPGLALRGLEALPLRFALRP